MKYPKSFFVKSRDGDKMARLPPSVTLPTVDSSKDDKSIIQNLRQQICHLESIISTKEKEAKLREETLQKLVYDVEQKYCKLQEKLEEYHYSISITEERLAQLELDQKKILTNVKVLHERVQIKEQTLCKSISMDRVWLDKKTHRRAIDADLIRLKNDSQLARLSRR